MSAGGCRYWVLLRHPKHGWIVMGTYDDLPAGDLRDLRASDTYDVIDRKARP